MRTVKNLKYVDYINLLISLLKLNNYNVVKYIKEDDYKSEEIESVLSKNFENCKYVKSFEQFSKFVDVPTEKFNIFSNDSPLDQTLDQTLDQSGQVEQPKFDQLLKQPFKKRIMVGSGAEDWKYKRFDETKDVLIKDITRLINKFDYRDNVNIKIEARGFRKLFSTNLSFLKLKYIESKKIAIGKQRSKILLPIFPK